MASEAVAKIESSVLTNYSEEQLNIIRNNVASPSFTNDELAYCLSVARARNLDPLKKQVYFSKRRKRNDQGEWAFSVLVEPTIDGFRSMAEETTEVDGYDGPYWCGPDGEWRDAWLAKEAPTAAKITVFRKGRSHGYTAVARHSAYVQTTKDGAPNHIWAKMPDNQLAKCAEALALRKAFPQQLGQFYTHEEMGQADNSAFSTLPKEEARPQVVDAPPANVRALEKPKAKAAAPKKWTAEQPLPEVLLRGLPPPVRELASIPLKRMAEDDLELVIEQGKASYAKWKPLPGTNAKLLALLQEVIVQAELLLRGRQGNEQPPPNDAPMDADQQPQPNFDPETGEVFE